MKYANLINCKTESEVRQAVLEWSSDKSEKEHLIRSAILEIHALVEKKIKHLLYEFLIPSIPFRKPKKQYENDKQALYNKVSKMSYSQVLRLLKPGLNAFNNVNLEPIDELNNIRNMAVHGDIDKAVYKGRNPFKDYDCLAQIFFQGWAIRETLDKYYEIYIDSPRYNFKKYSEFYHKSVDN